MRDTTRGVGRHAHCATEDDVYREVVCRALDAEWERDPDGLRAQYDAMKTGYLWWGRALGAFIAHVVRQRPATPTAPKAQKEPR